MNHFEQYFMRPVVGIISRTGVRLDMASQVPNPFTLHNFAKRNYVFRRQSSYNYCSGILHHKSRATIKY